MTKKKKQLIIGGVVGFMLILALAYSLPRLTHTVTSPEPTAAPPAEITPKELRSVKAIEASDDLSDMVFNEAKGLYYISSFDEGKIYAIGLESQTVDGEIPVVAPNRMLLNPAINKMYVTSADTVKEVGLNNFTVERSVKTGVHPLELLVADSGKRLFVVNEFSDNVAVIDTDSFSLIATIPVGKRPVDIAKDRNGEFVYVVNKEDASVSKISVSNLSVVSTIENVGRPVVIEAYPGKDLMLILDQYGDNVIVLDTNTDKIVKTIKTVDYPAAIAFDLGNNRFFVSSFTKSSIGIIDIEKEAMVSELQLGTAFQPISGLNNMIYNAQSKSLIVTNTNTGKVFFVPVD